MKKVVSASTRGKKQRESEVGGTKGQWTGKGERLKQWRKLEKRQAGAQRQGIAS